MEVFLVLFKMISELQGFGDEIEQVFREFRGDSMVAKHFGQTFLGD